MLKIKQPRHTIAPAVFGGIMALGVIMNELYEIPLGWREKCEN